MGCSHTNFTKGKRVFVQLNDGDSFPDKFIERNKMGR